MGINNLTFKLTQEQKLALTQSMILSIKLLQMPIIDLFNYVNNELSENPVLEGEFRDKEVKEEIDYKKLKKYLEFDRYDTKSFAIENDEVSPFSFISGERTLKDFLYEQLREVKQTGEENYLCTYIIENIDDRGYLPISDEEISVETNMSIDAIRKALNIIQSMDPAGIAARDIKECLILQLERNNKFSKEIQQIINYHLEDIADNKFNNIAKELNITAKEVQEYFDIIKHLQPKPSRGFYTGDNVAFVFPDVEIRKVGNQYEIIMEDRILPKLSINKFYRQVINSTGDEHAKSYINEKMEHAIGLINGIEQRKQTLYKVMMYILNKQVQYFDEGVEKLKPMTIKEVSETLSFHESTISRAIKDKYVLTPRGIILIKKLFTTALNKETEDLSVVNIKNRIKSLIDGEDKLKPLSDQNICNILNNESLPISRRTVAKYREELGIKSSSKRKRI